MRAWVGTSGYSYAEWKGSFYPAELRADQMLRFYAQRFRAVEINNTFYRMPSSELLARWKQQVPEDFRFVLKAPQSITHRQRLQNSDATLAILFEKAGELGAKLGPILFQLPPQLRLDLPRLEAFVALLPPGRRAAFEFRHRSWFDDQVFEALRARDLALCIADGEVDGEIPLVATASWGYLRLRRVAYDGAALEAWAQRIRPQPWSDVYVFFKHEDEATGPKLAARFLELF
ncbi:MAG TPA: DUF72 domain-containing protein [Acidobacteriota bacterium]